MNDCQFYPYQQVLVRNAENQIWRPTFFGIVTKKGDFLCTDGLAYKYCIQYAGNEELCGTVGTTRSRAENGDLYYFVNMFGEVGSNSESGDIVDKELFQKGNYFLDSEEAEKVANIFREVLLENSKGKI